MAEFGSWKCEVCTLTNPKSAAECNSCGARATVPSTTTTISNPPATATAPATTAPGSIGSHGFQFGADPTPPTPAATTTTTVSVPPPAPATTNAPGSGIGLHGFHFSATAPATATSPGIGQNGFNFFSADPTATTTAPASTGFHFGLEEVAVPPTFNFGGQSEVVDNAPDTSNAAATDITENTTPTPIADTIGDDTTSDVSNNNASPVADNDIPGADNAPSVADPDAPNNASPVADNAIPDASDDIASDDNNASDASDDNTSDDDTTHTTNNIDISLFIVATSFAALLHRLEEEEGDAVIVDEERNGNWVHGVIVHVNNPRRPTRHTGPRFVRITLTIRGRERDIEVFEEGFENGPIIRHRPSA
jgi:hypothetical protein